MAVYVKVGPWVNGAPPALSAANLDQVETQYDCAMSMARTIVLKTADETVNNSIVLQNDNELVLPVLINQVWDIEMTLFINSSAVADFKWAFTIPAGGALVWWHFFTAANWAPATSTDATVASTLAGAGVDQVWNCKLRYVGAGNAGNVQLQWAQNVAEVSNTNVLKNSYFKAFLLS